MKKLFASTKRHAMRIFLSFLILLVFLAHASKAFEINLIHLLELKAYDARLAFTAPNTLDDRIVILDIDEKSLQEIGRWPWNRAVMAEIFDTLFAHYQINLLGIDIVFAEPDQSSGLLHLKSLANRELKDSAEFMSAFKALKPQLDYDALLVRSMENKRIVLGYTFTFLDAASERVELNVLPEPVFTKEEIEDIRLTTIGGSGFVSNLPEFQAVAHASGYFNLVPDADGISRRVPLLQSYQEDLYESLALAVARVYLDEGHLGLKQTRGQNYQAVEAVALGKRLIPVDDKMQTLIPFRGKRGSFPYVSVVDVLKKRIVDPALLKNKIVLLGTTAQGLLDLRATPFETVYPGVEIHANLISGMLDNSIMANPEYVKGIEFTMLLIAGLIMIFIMPLFNPAIASICTFLLMSGMIWLNLQIWYEWRLVVPIVSVVVLILLHFLFNMSYGYLIESRNKRQLTHLFGHYVPTELVNEMSRDPDFRFSMEGESREMTVLFSDVRGFTTISEGLAPQELTRLMNEYLTPMTRVIHEQRGTIDKYMGDAIMAFWGAPLPDGQHARHAVEAAMKMIERLAELQPYFKAQGWPEIHIGVGLNTGVMNVGNMGSQFRMAYTVLGDAVNLGSRLEGLTKQYGVSIIVSESTKLAVPEYVYQELDRVRVKGKDQPVAIYEPLGLRQTIDRSILDELNAYDFALEAYRRQDWMTAQHQFRDLCRDFPHRKLYQLYSERVAHFMDNPPPMDWEGVYNHTSK